MSDHFKKHFTFIEGSGAKGSCDALTLDGYLEKTKEPVKITTRIVLGTISTITEILGSLTEKACSQQLEKKSPGLCLQLKSLNPEVENPAMTFLQEAEEYFAENSTDDGVTRDPVTATPKFLAKLAAMFAASSSAEDGVKMLYEHLRTVNPESVLAEVNNLVTKNGRDENGLIRLKAPKKPKTEETPATE